MTTISVPQEVTSAAERVFAELCEDTSGCDRWLDRADADDIGAVVGWVFSLVGFADQALVSLERADAVAEMRMEGAFAAGAAWAAARSDQARGFRAEDLPADVLRDRFRAWLADGAPVSG